jgi:hypothetical protein
MTIPPLSTRKHVYTVPSDKLTGAGKYTFDLVLKVGMVPINLINAIKGVGFDYNMSTRDIADGIRNGHTTVMQKKASISVEAAN